MLSPWIGLSDPVWRDLEVMREEMNKLFGLGSPMANIRGVAQGTFPAVNVGETSEQVIVYVFAPGIDPAGMELTIEKNLLSIAAGRDTSKDIGEKPKPEGYYRQERFSGNFKRVISLPESIDPGKVEARYKNGILVVTINKKEEEKARKINVAVG